MVPLDGLQLAVWEWPGQDPPLLFAHATGFHGRCWDQIARHFPARRMLAIEFRGHGRSSKPDPPYPWAPFAADLQAVIHALDVHGAVGIGHSMGGHVVTAAAMARPEAFSALVLIDATIFPPERYGRGRFDASFVRRRRAVFDSAEAMFHRFHNRPPFAGWQPEVLRDYCRFGVLPFNGHFVLACPPDVEASIYEHSTEAASNLHPGIPSVTQPVLVMRCDIPYRDTGFDVYASPTAADLAQRFPNGRDLLLTGYDHFIPMSAPELVAEWIGRYLP